VQAGFELYRKLEKMGFEKLFEEEAELQLLETHSHACYCVLAGSVPLSKQSLEGRLQRQLILYERGVRIKDPMDFFEEITRYKLSKGIWPTELLYSPEQLDALVAAYTAWLAVTKAENIIMIGDVKEGKIVLPERELKEKY
jgi:type IV secretory pathway ATPase VirB11/archaellum biosynthesis ATPase